MRKIAYLCITLFMTVTSGYAAAPNDFDADGVSDFTRVEQESDDSLTWKAKLSTTAEASTLGSLGSLGDHIIMAQWLGSGTQIGVVRADETSGDLIWSIKDNTAQTVEKTFGKAGDLAIAGGDFNGNGIADAAVVRLSRGRAVWEISYDLFTSETPTTQSIRFGKTGDRAFFARVDGSGVDSIGVMRKGRSRRSSARMKNLVTGEVKTFSRLPKFASTGARPRANGIRQSSGADLLAFQIDRTSSTRVQVYTFEGVKAFSKTFGETGYLVVGDFNTGEGYEIAFQGEAESVVMNPISGDAQSVEGLGGVAVDEINVNVVGKAVESDPSDDSSNDNSGGGSSIAQCSSIVSWPSKHIYKTIGSEHFSDIRRNTVGIVVKPGGRGPFPSCVQAMDTQGNVIAKLGLYQRGNGWAARYYAGIGCGSSTPLNGSAVASRARASTGSPNVYMNFDGICYGPINAAQCIGSNQC